MCVAYVRISDQLSRLATHEILAEFLKAACRVIRQGHGYPSVFNADTYVLEMVRQGKSLTDAREGGCSGCIEVGAFGKEAYVLTGMLMDGIHGKDEPMVHPA